MIQSDDLKGRAKLLSGDLLEDSVDKACHFAVFWKFAKIGGVR